MMPQDNRKQNKPQPSNRTESVRLPMDYFILPLCLSFQTPFYFFTVVIGSIAAITDPILPHCLELDWIDFAVRVILLVGFTGMCCCKEWAVWLTVIVQVSYTVWVIWAIIVNTMLLDPFLLLWYVYLAYEILIIAACFYALWRCSRFRKNQSRVTSSNLTEGEKV